MPLLRRNPPHVVPAPLRPPLDGSGARALIAAAANLADPDGPAAKRQAAYARKRQEAWQERTWEYLEEIPEVGRYGRYMGNAFSRLELFVGIRPKAGADPVPLEDEGDTELGYTKAEASVCAEVLGTLTSPEGGQAEIKRRLGFQFAIPGECYLVGRPLREDAEEQRWDVYSVAELNIKLEERQQNSAGEMVPTVYLNEPGKTTGGEQLPADTYVARLWRPHEAYSQWATSALRSSGGILSELLILTKAIESGALSRVAGSGYLFLPNSMRNGPPREAQSEANGQALGSDDTVTDMIEVSSAAIGDPQSAAARVPLVIWVNDDVWANISTDKWLKPDREIDPIAAAQRGELITRFANAIDIPSQILTGTEDVNHWGMWQIPEDAFKTGVEPTAILADEALTEQFLVPSLEALGMPRPERFVVWHDATKLVSRPDKVTNAGEAHKAIVISDERYRRDLGYGDDDAPEPDEVARRVAIEAARAGRTPGPVPPAGAENVDKGPPVQEVQEAIVAAVRDTTLDGLTDDLAAMDYGLLLFTQQVADAAMHRALERANSRLRTLAARDQTARDIIARNPGLSLDTARTLGPGLVAQLAGDEDLVGAAAFASLESRYRTRLERVSDEAILLAQKDGDLSDAEADELRRQYADERDPSWSILLAALLAAGARLLFRPEPEGPPGEVDGALVSAGVVRDALARAGGGGDRAVSMLTGNLVERTYRQAGIVFTGYEWRYGDASLRVRPFKPHQALNGTRFSDVSDGRLGASAGGAAGFGFPGVSHYWPGDHRGCLCLIARVAQPEAPQKVARAL